MRGEEKLPGAEEAVPRWRCCGRGWWRCRSSRTAAPGSAAAVPNVRFPFLPMFRSSLFFPSLSSLSLFFFPLFFLCFSLLSVSLFFRFFLSLSSVFFVFSFFPPLCSLLFLSSLLLCWLLFIEPSEWLFAVEHGEQPAGRPLGATAKARPPSPVFWQVRGGWSAIVSGRWAPGERVAGKNSN